MPDDIAELLKAKLPAAETAGEQELADCQLVLRNTACNALVELTGENPIKVDIAPYALRLTQTLLLHINKEQTTNKKLSDAIEDQLHKLAAGHMAYGKADGNLVQDVIVAEALGNHVEAAAQLFEEEYMPMARAVARRAGGEAAVAVIDNLAADLILPRKSGSTRISTYRGKTLLRSWLRVMVLNLWYSDRRSAARQPGQSANEEEFEAPASSNEAHSECEALLEQPLQNAVDSLETSERVLLKMLLLDGAPQNELAERLKVPAWKITRRKQRASANLFAAIKSHTAQADSQQAIQECLQLVLGGESTGLRNRIGEILATSITDGSQGGDLDLP